MIIACEIVAPTMHISNRACLCLVLFVCFVYVLLFLRNLFVFWCMCIVGTKDSCENINIISHILYNVVKKHVGFEYHIDLDIDIKQRKDGKS